MSDCNLELQTIQNPAWEKGVSTSEALSLPPGSRGGHVCTGCSQLATVRMEAKANLWRMAEERTWVHAGIIWAMKLSSPRTVSLLDLQLLEKNISLWVILFSSVQLLSHVQLFATPWIPARQASLSIPEFTQTHVHRVSDTIQPSHPRSSPSSPVPNLSQHQSLFQWSTLHMRWPKYWSFSFSIIPFKEIPGLISFRMDWLDLLAVRGTLKNLLQHHSSKASILQHSAFFTVQLSHPYMTTGKTIALTRRTFVGKVTSLLLNMLSRLVIAFLPRSKRLLISWLQSPSAVILEPPKIKSDTVSTVSPTISHEVMGPDAMIFSWDLSQLFDSPLSLSSRGVLVPLHFLP